ncbi:Lrp/AsnC family transcriptional regulator [Paracoccus benzoatiresistens]|uniref:Lrp/AsnC family transcriptional regulator n=1 Tax=Paracoccus benzoatiresistens TaxID=2997341 RepID=A0ABT4J8T0_9RHOB|nr:Lrp/AsnC family transcriptional regulator [Paracoccus sp. EF6]MCZ0962997.1 Lrp/AsnC family transcriptional regulator [Paracoccus sp. EF6]
MKRELDRIDRRILAELQRDGRLSRQELSERVGLSPTPCLRRMRMLEEEGVITGFTVLVDETQVGFGFSVFVSVKLDRQVDDQLVAFEKAIALCPEVVDCWLMTGSRDYLLRIAVANLREFEQFLTGKLTKVPGVASLETAIPIRRVKGHQARIA